ncbi:hypothetical protein [Haloarcula rubripromontorii]|nr:hypothetical protein [Haloarcula rubripromontorii]
MRRVQACLVGALVISAGCAGLGDVTDTRSRLDLTVQNDGSEAISFQIVVTDADGAVIANESDRLAGSVGQSYVFTVDTTGRHEVRVAGADWRGQIAWNANACANYEGTIRVTADEVAVAGECVQQQ